MKLTIFQQPPAYFKCFYYFAFSLIFLISGERLSGQNITSQRDLTEPSSSAAEALCGPIEIITLCTNHPDSLVRFFEGGWGLRKLGPFAPGIREKRRLSKQWQLQTNTNFQLMYFDRPSAPGTILLRILIFEQNNPLIRSGYGPGENGPFTIGFPNARQEEVHDKMLSLGYTTLAPMQAALLSKPDGSKYNYLETIYKGPEWIHAVGIERGNGMPQLSNIDSATGLGGPGYSAMNVTGMGDTMIAFLTNILGYEIRRDQVWTTGKGSALGLPAGMPFRFVIAYAKGATSGQLLLMDFQKKEPIISAHPPHLPNRGIGMYSVTTDQLEEVLTRAIQAGIKILSPPQWCREPLRGSYKSMVLLAPNQVYLEVIERKK
jgi:hypothetical protein